MLSNTKALHGSLQQNQIQPGLKQLLADRLRSVSASQAATAACVILDFSISSQRSCPHHMDSFFKHLRCVRSRQPAGSQLKVQCAQGIQTAVDEGHDGDGASGALTLSSDSEDGPQVIAWTAGRSMNRRHVLASLRTRLLWIRRSLRF